MKIFNIKKCEKKLCWCVATSRFNTVKLGILYML